MELELRQLFRYARRWWWLLLILPLAAGGAAYAVSSRQQPLYSATATVMVNLPQSSTADSLAALQTGKGLATTYQQLVATSPVLQPVVVQLGLPYDADTLKEHVSASTVRDTQLLRISVSETDPATAATIANAVANQFAVFASQQAVQSSSSSRDALQKLINQTQSEIETTQKKISQLESANKNDQTSQAELEDQRAHLSQLQTSYANLLVQAQQMDLSTAAAQAQVSVSVPAGVPKAPYAPRTTFYTLLGAFLGGLIAIGAVGLLEYLDNTVKPSLDFSRVFGVPLLSVIAKVSKLRSGHDQLYVIERPKSIPSEAMRLLRTNLEFAAAAKEIATLSVTSAGPGEGKSTITANLAAATAKAGLLTVIIDADLRRPSQHQIWQTQNQRGLSTLLMRPDISWHWVAMNDIYPNLSLIASGPIPPNPADLLSSDRFRQLVQEISKSVDLVIIDTSPVLAVSDPLIVATGVDGVVVVSRANRTRIDALKHAISTLSQGSVRIVGIVLNQQTGRTSEGYYYYGDYYGPTENEHPSKPGKPSESATPRVESPAS